MTTTRVRATLRRILEKQVASGEPPETRYTFARLFAYGLPEDEVWRLLSYVLAAELESMAREDREFSHETFAAALAALPNLPARPEKAT